MTGNTVDAYEQALERFPGDSSHVNEGVKRFGDTFADLTADDIGKQFEALYAQSLYFNDTIHAFDSRSELIDYITQVGSSLSESQVEIKKVIYDGNDVFVRWTMEFRTRAAGRNIHSHSIGMTHLRFDSEGRVVLHQDFWDSGNALYAHLPFVGYAVRRARSAMQ